MMVPAVSTGQDAPFLWYDQQEEQREIVAPTMRVHADWVAHE
jgi:hypothetical protein